MERAGGGRETKTETELGGREGASSSCIPRWGEVGSRNALECHQQQPEPWGAAFAPETQPCALLAVQAGLHATKPGSSTAPAFLPLETNQPLSPS